MTPIIPNHTMSQTFAPQSPYNRIDCLDPNVQKKKKNERVRENKKKESSIRFKCTALKDNHAQ